MWAGGAFTDSQGRAWSADGNFTGTSGTFAVGQPISGTVDDALYQKVRYGSSFSVCAADGERHLHGGRCTWRRSGSPGRGSGCSMWRPRAAWWSTIWTCGRRRGSLRR